jgi:uridine kinase
MIIGLIGLRFSGKSTAAEVIKSVGEELGVVINKFDYCNYNSPAVNFNKLDPNQHYVLDSLASIEDLEMLMRRGGRPYKIESNNDMRKMRGFIYNREIDESMMEKDLDFSGHTYYTLGGGVIWNTKTLEVFRTNLKDMVKEVFIPKVLK